MKLVAPMIVGLAAAACFLAAPGNAQMQMPPQQQQQQMMMMMQPQQQPGAFGPPGGMMMGAAMPGGANSMMGMPMMGGGGAPTPPAGMTMLPHLQPQQRITPDPAASQGEFHSFEEGASDAHINGVAPLANPFDDKPREIVVAPSYGPTSGGVWVQIMGAGSYHTPNSLQCKLDLVEQFCYSNHYYYSWCYLTPKCAGVYDMNCHNGPLKFHGRYAVVAKTPWVTSVYPFSGDTAGGTPVSVRGWNFEPHCPHNLLCRFGTQVVRAKYYTQSAVMCISPCAQDKGFVSVEVSNDGGQHWSMSGVQYGYVGEPPKDSQAAECSRYLAHDMLSAPQADFEETEVHSSALVDDDK